jgi:hypothetical protein
MLSGRAIYVITLLQIGGQLGQVAGLPPALAQRLAPEPGDDLDHIHGRRRQELLEVRPCQPDVATAAQIKASRALREATLEPCTQGVLGFELRGLLALPRGLDRLVVGLQPDRELAWGASRRGTRLAGGARATSRSVKPDVNRGTPETSCPGRQWTLVWPWGQRACWASQSKTKACKS